jgi:hypothetical protein
MNDQVIIAVANAITANAEVLKSLIDALPRETKAAVEKRVSKNTPVEASVAIAEPTTPAVVAAPVAPVVAAPVAPVVVSTTPSAAMPPAPFPNVVPVAPAAVTTPVQVAVPTVAVAPVTPAAVAQPAAVSPSSVPFSDHANMLKWTMDKYTKLGPELGKQIQDVLNSLGTKNINDVTPDKYAAFFNGVESIK